VFVLPDHERVVVDLAREFVRDAVKPVVRHLEHGDIYPTELINTMKEVGFYGLLVPEEYGGTPVSLLCFAQVTEEISKGWMSLAGAFGGHSVTCFLIDKYGTAEQKAKWLPHLATGEGRGTMALTEPGGGSDLQAMRTVARRQGDSYIVNGSKTFITSAQSAQYFSMLVKTDTHIQPAHKGISLLIAEPGPGFVVSRKLDKLGYKGLETCELAFTDYEVPAQNLLGKEGEGFLLMMNGLEIGRIQVAARALGVAAAAYEDALRYSQERFAFGKPIWEHQAVGHRLADMGTKLQAARLLVYQAAAKKDSGQRSDLDAAMAKYYASEVCQEIAMDAIRTLGGYGYVKEYDVERYYRDAPLMIVGEGTNDVLKNVMIRQMIRENLR
jgi:alkylation response protein AidB-like acyl-CoA dehydrogenase